MVDIIRFDDDGLLPPGDYPLTFPELRRSPFVTGEGADSSTWDRKWRRELVGRLEILTNQLWEVGVERVFADGSFVEDKDHPNDIDGYFEVPLERLKSGDLEREMIRNDKEYKDAVARLADERRRLKERQASLESQGLHPEEIERTLDPIRSFHLQLEEEVEGYERLRQGDLGEACNLHGLGRMLVGLRIARRMSQKALAERLGTHESQVSRDERNEYHGITMERAARILDTLEVELVSHIADPVLPFEAK